MTQETAARAATQKTREEPIEVNRKFLSEIQKLYENDRGRIATLKRNSGNTLTGSRGLNWFYYYLMRYYPEVNDKRSNLCLLVASLMTFDRNTMRTGLPKDNQCDFGAFLAALRSPEELKAWHKTSRPGQTPLERRLVALLDSTFDEEGGGEMSFRLRQAVKFALSKTGSKEIRIDWPMLLEDLHGWDHPNKSVQKRWARSFYQVQRSPELETHDEKE